MQSILRSLSQGLFRKVLALCLMTLLSLSGLVIFTSLPVNATTFEEIKLVPEDEQPTPDEKIERAYEMSEATGRLEEAKQQKTNPSENFDPNEKANVKNIVKSQGKNSKPGLIEIQDNFSKK